MSAAREPLLSPGLKSDAAPAVFIEMKEQKAKPPALPEALVALDKAEDLLAKKASYALCNKKFCFRSVLWGGGSISLGVTILGAFFITQKSCEKNSDSDCGGSNPGGIVTLVVGILGLLISLLIAWRQAKKKIIAEDFSDLTADEAKEMENYLGTVTTVEQSLGVELISIEGQWTKEMSATFFENAKNIKKSLSAKADLLAKRESTQERVNASMKMFCPYLEKNIPSIIADYAVCPRR